MVWSTLREPPLSRLSPASSSASRPRPLQSRGKRMQWLPLGNKAPVDRLAVAPDERPVVTKWWTNKRGLPILGSPRVICWAARSNAWTVIRCPAPSPRSLGCPKHSTIELWPEVVRPIERISSASGPIGTNTQRSITAGAPPSRLLPALADADFLEREPLTTISTVYSSLRRDRCAYAPRLAPTLFKS